jgi:hypothetical protein
MYVCMYVCMYNVHRYVGCQLKLRVKEVLTVLYIKTSSSIVVTVYNYVNHMDVNTKLLSYHYNNDYADAPQHFAICTLPVLLRFKCSSKRKNRMA